MKNSFEFKFSEIEKLMERAAYYIIECDVPLSNNLVKSMDENNTGEFGCEIKLLMDTYVHLNVNKMIEEMDVSVLLRDILWEGVPLLKIENIVREYLFKWCNKGSFKILSKTDNSVTIVNNDGDLNEEILINLFKDELFKLLT